MPGDNSELRPPTSRQSDTAVQQSQSPFHEQFESPTKAVSQSQDVPDAETYNWAVRFHGIIVISRH